MYIYIYIYIIKIYLGGKVRKKGKKNKPHIHACFFPDRSYSRLPCPMADETDEH